MTIESHLKHSFGQAAPAHFVWQTEHAYVAERERELVRSAFLPLGTRVLDIGCGEGATLLHLGAPARATGLDLFEEKIRYAQKRLPECRFVVGSAYELPFEDGAFDHVIVRDVIHHLEQPERLVRECARVLSRDGRFDALETCGRNPLIVAQSLLVPVERGQLRSTHRYLRSLLESRFAVSAVTHHQALPLHRVLFHPDLGVPSLGTWAPARSIVRALERLADATIPRAFWAYLHIRAFKSR